MTDTKLLIKQCLNKGILLTPDLKPIDLLDRDKDKDKTIDESILKEEKVDIEIVKSFKLNPRKLEYDDFYNYFINRFKKIRTFLQERQELNNPTSIKRLISSNIESDVAIIGMVKDKTITKNNNILITLEDTTGEIMCVVKGGENSELVKIAKDVILDEVLGIVGRATGNGTIFVSNIIFPDIPINNEFNGCDEEIYLACIGDTHIGSDRFLKDKFEQLISWLQGKEDYEKELASKVKYIVFIGDIVEGVGIYPKQEEELKIKDVKEQMRAFIEYVKKIPLNKTIIIIPGNHDPVRPEDPQPPISKEFASELYMMSNVYLTSSPSWIRLEKKKNKKGILLLLYHGTSFPFYADNVESIRKAGGQKAVDKILVFLLQRRHLSPTHSTNTYIPEQGEDFMIIDPIPDIFISGHIHRTSCGKYRGIITLNSSCWSEESVDQIKRGIEPQPGILPLINLKTGEVKLLDFYQKNG